MELSSIQFDARGGPAEDGAALGQRRHDPHGYHREEVMELLAKNPRLGELRKELLRRKTPTALRFWQLYERNGFRAAQLIKEVSTKDKPAAFLNTCLQREGITV
jgi:hypothetical protein